MLLNLLTNKFDARQLVLIDVLIKNSFDNVDPKLYHNMSVPKITEAMEEAHRRLAILNSTELGRALK